MTQVLSCGKKMKQLQIQNTVSGKTETITSKYLIGADGGKLVRKQWELTKNTWEGYIFSGCDVKAVNSLKQGMHFDNEVRRY